MSSTVTCCTGVNIYAAGVKSTAVSVTMNTGDFGRGRHVLSHDSALDLSVNRLVSNVVPSSYHYHQYHITNNMGYLWMTENDISINK